MIRILLILFINPLLTFGQPHGTIYFTDASYNVIYRLDGNKAIPIINQGLGFPWRLAADDNSLYWTNVDKNLIEKSNLNGTNRQEIAVITYPEGISIDQSTGIIYVSEVGTPAIIKLSPPSYLANTIYSKGLVDPDNIIFHPLTKKLYWLDVALGQIIMAKPDGTGLTVLFDNPKFEPQAIAIDKNARFLYWADIKQQGIIKFDLKSGQTDLIVKNLKKPTAVAINNKYNELIWIEATDKNLSWKRIDSSKIHSIKVAEISEFHNGLIVKNQD